MRLVSSLVAAALLGCAGLSTTPPVPAPAPAPAPAPPREVGGGDRLLPPLPERGAERPSDCMLDLEGLEPLLTFRQPDARTEVRMERKKGAVVERVAFTDGTVVRVSRHGCVHYGETWELAPFEAGADPRATAVDRIGKLTTRSGAPGIVDMLKRATGVELGETFTCGEGTCELQVEDRVLTVLYDFPL